MESARFWRFEGRRRRRRREYCDEETSHCNAELLLPARADAFFERDLARARLRLRGPAADGQCQSPEPPNCEWSELFERRFCGPRRAGMKRRLITRVTLLPVALDAKFR